MVSWRAVVLVCVTLAAALGGGAVRDASASVLVVGDSLGVGTEQALRAALPAAAIDADVLGGRRSGEGVPIVAGELRADHDTVVFDLGTNDGPRGVAATARSLVAARALVGGRCLVLATLNHPPVDGVSIAAQNDMIRRFVTATPNAALVDWHEAAQAAGALRADGVHATTAGYALRGALFAEAIQGCSGAGGSSGRASVGPGASTTDRPAAARRSRTRERVPLHVRAARAIADGSPGRAWSRIAGAGAALLGDAGASLVAVLTPRGPEPVLGGEGEPE